MAATARDVATWMVEQITEQGGMLYQEVAVHQIRDRFGDEFTLLNANGNLALAKNVLSAFNQLTGDDVVWSRGSRYWRRRTEYDRPGRQQE